METNDFTREENYPLMSMPKKEHLASDFDKKCEKLNSCIQHVYDFFIWYSDTSKPYDDEIFATIWLERLLLKILDMTHEIYNLRDKKLHCHNTDMFKKQLENIRKNICKGMRYIKKSGKSLADEMGKDPQWIAARRQDLIESFRRHAAWLRQVTAMPHKRICAERLLDEMAINYDMRMFGCTGDSFEQHANMVLNGFVLLACPSAQSDDTQVLCELFNNTMTELEKMKMWKSAFGAWKLDIVDAYEIRDITDNDSKMKFLRKIWKFLDEKEQALLNVYGISHANTRYESGKSTMCQNINENINGNMAENSARMDTYALQQYLSLVSQKQYIISEIDHLKEHPTLYGREEPPSKVRKNRPLFKKEVSQPSLTECFNDVYKQFYIDCCVSLRGGYKDLMVLLYIICKEKEYFESGEKNPFFRFCTEECGFQTEVKSARTFCNHLKAMDDFNPQDYCSSTRKAYKNIYDDYQSVKRIFQGSKNFLKVIKP